LVELIRKKHSHILLKYYLNTKKMQILANNTQHSKVVIQRIVAELSGATIEVKADASITKDAVVL
jgi:hypothetical protein